MNSEEIQRDLQKDFQNSAHNKMRSISLMEAFIKPEYYAYKWAVKMTLMI